MAAPTATTSSGLTLWLGSLLREVLDELLDDRHARGAADEHHFFDVVDGELGVADRVLERLDAALGEIGGQLFELRAGERVVEVLGPVLVGRDERQVDGGLHHRRQLDLGLLGRLGEALQRLAVAAQIDALVLLELGDQPVDDALVVVVAAELRVAVGRLDLEDAVADFEDRDVERAAAQVPDEDRLVALLLQAVGERSRGRLVDDAQHVEAGDAPGVLCGLALGVVEVRGDRDDGSA